MFVITNYQAHLGDVRFLRLEIDRTAAGVVILQALAMCCDDREIQRACTRLARRQMGQVRRLQLLLVWHSGRWRRVPDMCPYLPDCHGALGLIYLEMQAGATRLGAQAQATECCHTGRLCQSLAAERAEAAQVLAALL